MNYKKFIYKSKSLKLIIDEDIVGYYLIVYTNPESDKSQADYLQDTLDDAFLEAEERFGVRKDQWQEINATS